VPKQQPSTLAFDQLFQMIMMETVRDQLFQQTLQNKEHDSRLEIQNEDKLNRTEMK